MLGTTHSLLLKMSLSSESEVLWHQLIEYYGVEIRTPDSSFRNGFGLYFSHDNQLAWAPYKPGHEPHINPQKAMVDNANKEDIGIMLAQMCSIEIKRNYLPRDIMKENKDLIARILDDLHNFNSIVK